MVWAPSPRPGPSFPEGAVNISATPSRSPFMTIDALALGVLTSTADVPKAVNRATNGPVDAAGTAGTFGDEFWPLFTAAFGVAYRILNDRHAAEDVAADAMARAHLHWRRVGALPYRKAWVLRVASNRAIDTLRRAPLPPDPATNAGAAFEDALAIRLTLARALQRLPRRQRETVVLRYVAGLSLDETAATLGIGVASVRTHVNRGLRALRNVLGDRHLGELPDEEDLDVQS
jgi:RNA polymerase sigma factor (sigma-70 family)